MLLIFAVVLLKTAADFEARYTCECMQSESSAAIDLSLAVNYLPACSCMGKSFLLSLCLCATRSLALAPAYVGVGLLLVFDRLLHGRPSISAAPAPVRCWRA